MTWQHKYVSLAVFLFFAISLIVPSGFSVGAAMLMLAGVWVCIKREPVHLDRQDKILLGILIGYFLIGTVMNLVHSAPVRDYDLPARMLMAALGLIALRRYAPTPSMLWGGLAIGGILAGIFAGWQDLFILHDASGNLVGNVSYGTHDRAGGFTNAIQYGDISFAIGMLCLAGIGWAKFTSRAGIWSTLLIAGMVFGVAGAVFSGSRGSWWGLPACVFLFGLWGIRQIRATYLVGALAVLVAGCAIVYLLPQTHMKERTLLAFTEAQGYADKRDAGTSIGTRIEMWRVGAIAASERPILGWGKQGLVERETELIQSGRIDARMQGNNHVYNEWLDAMAKRGLPGLLILLALYFYPLAIFARNAWNRKTEDGVYGIAGVLFVTSYIVFGLSQAFMAHNSGVMSYGFGLVIIWSLLPPRPSNHRNRTK